MAHATHEEALFPTDDDWLDSSVPAELAKVIADQFGAEDLERLADASFTAALQEENPTYTIANPQLRNVAKSALRMALGLKPLPYEQEGEQ